MFINMKERYLKIIFFFLVLFFISAIFDGSDKKKRDVNNVSTIIGDSNFTAAVTNSTETVAATAAEHNVSELDKPESFNQTAQQTGNLIKNDLSIKTHKANTENENVNINKSNKISESERTKKFFIVTKVVDGDTIDIDLDGKTERIRMIGLNTPETVDPRKPVECFGEEASARAKELLADRKVKLQADATQSERDKYSRLLRYVWRDDGLFFNLEMIKQGYGYEYTYDLPYQYQAEFKAAQKYAERNKLGLWADNACADFFAADKPASLNSPDAPAPNPLCLIKGNINSKGEKIYHLPKCDSYAGTAINESAGEKWFCSEAEAAQAGWRKAKNCL